MSDSLRILMVTSSLTGGGAGNHILNLCRYLGSVGISAQVLTIAPQKQQIEEILENEGVNLHRLPVRSLAGLISPHSISRLKEIIKEVSPDIIHGHLYHGEMTASIASSLARVPLVTTRHSSGLEFNGIRLIPARLASRCIRAAIAVSSDAGREARGTGIPGDRVYVIHNGVDTRRYVPLDDSDRRESRNHLIRDLFPGDVPTDPVLIGAAGALLKVKNYQLFISVASGLLSRDPGLRGSLRFVIAGEGGMREELERQTREADLEDIVSMPGYIGGLDDYFPCLDIFLMTSKSEGVPIALLEAMSSGAACVASDTGDIAEVIGDAGFAVPPGDREGFIDAVSRLLADEAERRRLGHMARVRILERYNTDIWGDRTVRVYRSLLDGSGR